VIEALAVSWLIENEEGLSPTRSAEFERWKNADPRHAAAVARFNRSADVLAKWPLLPDAPASAAGKRNPAARPAFLVFAGMAAGLAIAAAGWWAHGRHDAAFEKLATAGGGYQRATLADGSVVELNANTEIRVRYEEKARRIELVRGEAYFAVAKNKARPFTVANGPLSVTAVGTAFNVKVGAAGIGVLVTEGSVHVERAAGAAGERRALSLAAGDNASLDRAGAELRADVTKVSFESMRDALEWRQPKLVFANTPLADVVAQFNLRNQLQISIEDEALAARPVAGTFRADNVSAFVRLLEEQGEVSVERRDHARFILRKPAAR